jgi:hypothetical protein
MKTKRENTKINYNPHQDKTMKILKPKRFFYLLLFIFFLTISCTKEDLQPAENINATVMFDNNKIDVKILNKDYIQSAPLREKLIYKDYHLTSLMGAVIKTNANFGNLSELKKTKENERPAVYLESLLNSDGGSQKVNKDLSIGAFTDLDGETWYPVLELFKEGDNIVKNSVYLVKSFDENSEKEFVKAYKSDENGNLNLIDNDFTEDEFLNNYKSSNTNSSVYVLKVIQPCDNQPVRFKNNPKLIEVVGTCSSGGSTGGGNNGNQSKMLKIESFVIKDKKESWIEKADVHIFGYNVNMNIPDPNNSGSSSKRFNYFIKDNPNYGNSAYLMAKVSNRDVRKRITKTVNYDLVNSDWDGFTVYVIFEYDSWPSPIKYNTVNLPDGTVSRVYWRSYNNKYAAYIVKSNRNVQFNNFPLIYGFGFGYGNKSIEYKHNSY